jgi:signal transduction histidine kinase
MNILYKWTRNFLFLFLVHSFFFCSKPQENYVSNGILDLTNKDPNHFLVNLSGKWDFYWGEFLMPPYKDLKRESILVPGNWKARDQKSETAIGIGTYSIKILLPENANDLFFKFYSVRHAFTLYINSQKVITAGNPTDTADSFQISKKTFLLPAPKEKELILTFHVSNQIDQYQGGINRVFLLGTKDEVIASWLKDISFSIFLIGIQTFLFIFQFSLYLLNRKKEKASLFFSIASLFISIWILLSNERLLNYIFDINDFYTLKIYYFSLISFVVLYMYYFFYLYPREVSKVILKFFLFIYFLLNLFYIIDYKYSYYYYEHIFSYIFTLLAISYVAYFCKNIYLQKPEGWNFFLLSFIPLILTGFIDIINDIFHISDTSFSLVGLLIFNMTQTILVSSRISKNIQWAEIKTEVLQTKVEMRSIELQKHKDSAEQSQKELQATLVQLIQAEKMATLGNLVAGVAHEINTPLSAIKASAENISEVVAELQTQLNPEVNNFDQDDWKIISKILPECGKSNKTLSTKEARSIKKSLTLKLDGINIQSADEVADMLMGLGLYENSENYLFLFQNSKYNQILAFLSIIHGIKLKSKIIDNSSMRVSKIVKSLKTFTHFDQSGNKTLSDIREGMETVLTIYHNAIKHGIDVIKIYEDVPMIYCFFDELNQIWTNLIHNSIQALNGKGNITIHIYTIENNNILSISIEDNGPGIPKEIQEKIFEPFFTTKPRGEGSGLGLHIIKKILEKHNGELLLETEPGRTKFTVNIPIIRVQES